jgi:hypothetical protein
MARFLHSHYMLHILFMNLCQTSFSCESTGVDSDKTSYLFIVVFLPLHTAEVGLAAGQRCNEVRHGGSQQHSPPPHAVIPVLVTYLHHRCLNKAVVLTSVPLVILFFSRLSRLWFVSIAHSRKNRLG